MAIHIQAQKDITFIGTATDSLNNPVPYLDVLLKKNDSTQQILAFAITNDFGQYKITHPLEEKSVIIEMSSLTFQKTQKTITITDAIKYTVDFSLEERTETLEEIEIVAQQRVRIKNDTTVFNLDRLKDGTEKVVEDVLKKLPGVEIEDNGKIKFKGKDVGNVLLDGDNLFDGGYTVGTKTINSDHVEGIEAIENFEDNPLLQGLTQNDKVALNLKFKAGFNFSGKAELGYGYQDRYYANTTAIAITKKLKGHSTLNYNNMGKGSGARHFDAMDRIMFLNRGQDESNFKAKGYIDNEASNSLMAGTNNIKNDAFYGTFNILPKLSKNKTLRVNLDYFSDQSLQENRFSQTITDLSDPDNPVFITQSQSNRNTTIPRFFNGKLMFNSYLNKKSTLFTQFKFSKLRTKKDNLGTVNGQQQDELIRQKEHYIFNTTNYTYRINDKSALKINGTASFSETPETLTLLTGIDFNTNTLVPNTTNNQDVYSKKQAFAINSNYFTRSKKGHKLNTYIDLNYFKSTLNTTLTDINDFDIYNNNTEYKVFTPMVKLSYFMKFDKLEITPGSITALYQYNYKDLANNASEKGSEFLFNSNLNLSYKFDQKHALTASLETKNEAPKEEYLYTNYILKANRLLQDNVLNFEKRSTNSFNVGYNYNDLFKDYNARLSYNYNKSNQTYFNNRQFFPDVSYITYLLGDFGRESNNINLFFSKYVSPLKTTFTINSSYNKDNYFNVINNSDVRKNKSETYNLNLKMGTAFIGKFIFSNELGYAKTTFSSENFSGFTNESMTNNFSVLFAANERLQFDADLNYQIPNIDVGDNRTLDLQASIDFTNKKKNLNYKLEGKNLLNQGNVNQVNNSDFATGFSTQTILERFVLLTVGFRF
jgi:hypothetical protein